MKTALVRPSLDAGRLCSHEASLSLTLSVRVFIAQPEVWYGSSTALKSLSPSEKNIVVGRDTI